MITLILTAATAQGFGGESFYTDTVQIEETPEALRRAKVDFALRFGVELDSIWVEKIS